MSPSDWALLVVLPLLLLAAGVLLLLRGRAALAQARRIKGGFGGPPGSHDVGLDVGFDVDPERERAQVLSAQRQVLWGWILVGVAVVWLLVALLTRLV